MILINETTNFKTGFTFIIKVRTWKINVKERWKRKYNPTV